MFNVRPAESNELLMLATFEASEEIVTIMGPVYVYASWFRVYKTGIDAAFCNVREGIPRWFKVDVQRGEGYDYEFLNGGLYAPETAATLTEASFSSASTFVVPVACTFPVLMRTIPVIGSVTAKRTYIPTSKMVYTAGAAVGNATKTQTTQGAAGYTSLLNTSGSSRAGLLTQWRIEVRATSATTFIGDPLWLGVQLTTATLPLQFASLAPGLMIGPINDLLPIRASGNAMRIDMLWALPFNVQSVGYWFGAAESTGAVNSWAFQVWAWDAERISSVPITGNAGAAGSLISPYMNVPSTTTAS